MSRFGSKGITLIELIVVFTLMALLAVALYKLVSTTYTSWRIDDRRVEILQIGRPALSKLNTEIRKAYDISSVADPAVIDFYPDYASNTAYRFGYDALASDFEFGASAGFASDSLAAPVTYFSYTAYTRRLATGANYRQANSFAYSMKVDDELGILPSNIVPMEFDSKMQMRVSREGWMISKSLSFASESYLFTKSSNDNVCIKAFCDRIDVSVIPLPVAQTAKIEWLFGGAPLTFDYYPAGGYFATCANTVTAALFNTDLMVTIDLDDSTETLHIEDRIIVTP